ncbi:MAG: 3-dehydroquinate synthase [Patescibacteria group bacterium]
MKIRVVIKKSREPASYTIVVEQKALSKLPKLLREKDLGSHYCIITDNNVKKLYGGDLLEEFKKRGLTASLIAIAPGEHSKSLTVAATICEKMIELGVRRDGCVIALGGGVVGDLAGFAASVYMRGINLVQVPTTLLAMVDSSIGGKTGVDLASGKNLVGTFYQPSMVVIDPSLLPTMPAHELRNGLAEMVKHGVIKSRSIFLEIEKNYRTLLSGNIQKLTGLIVKNLKVKARIVESDDRESLAKKKSNVSRMLLNYGHTIGHAIEKISGYTIRHGEAISIGMAMENIIAVKKKMLSQSEAERIEKLLKNLKLPTRLPSNISLKQINAELKKDKKNIDGRVHFVLPVRIGEAVIRDDIV